jgi:O-antigen/teichoic acid export membrane protein
LEDTDSASPPQAPAAETAVTRPPEASGVMAHLLTGSAAIALIWVLGAALQYGSQVAFARWMGASHYGNYVYAIALGQILEIASGLGLPNLLMRFVPSYVTSSDWMGLRGIVRRSRQLTVMTSIALAAAITIVLWIVRPGHLDLTVLLLGTWLAPTAALSTLESEISHCLNRVTLAYLFPILIDPLMCVAFGLTLRVVLGRLSAIWMIIARHVSLLLTVVSQSFVSQIVLPAAARESKPRFETIMWLRASLPLLSVTGCYVILARADLLTLGWFRPPGEAGLYWAAAKTAGLGSMVLAVVNARGGPIMSAAWSRGDRPRFDLLARTIVAWAVWPSLVFAIVLWTAGSRILAMFGPGFAAGYSALAILVVGNLVNSATGPVTTVAIITGRQRAAASIYAWATVADLVLCVLLVPRLGSVGAAIATAVSMSLWNAWLHRVVRRDLGICLVGGLTDRGILKAASLLLRPTSAWKPAE